MKDSTEFASPHAWTSQATHSREQPRCVSVQTRPEDATTVPAITLLKATAINIIIWILVGGLLGWSASRYIGIRHWQGIAVNIIVGIVGVMLGAWLLGKLIGSSAFHLGIFSLAGLLVSIMGAAVLLAAVQLLGSVTRRRTPPRGSDRHVSGTRRRAYSKQPMATMHRPLPLERIR